MKSLLIKFDTQRTKILFSIAWITLVALWLFTTTDSETFQWVRGKGELSLSEFSTYGKMQFMIGLAIGISTPIIVDLLKARKL